MALRDQSDDFRDQLIAASLKRRRATFCRNRRSVHFRDQLIAASLKRRIWQVWSSAVMAFPRSADRGLIEAPRASVLERLRRLRISAIS